MYRSWQWKKYVALSAIALLALLAVPLRTGAAQEAEQAPPQSIFQQLFPEPTGTNGYEEIVLAGELTWENETMTAAIQRNATLTVKRAALADPKNIRALALLRQALAKPIRSPRQVIVSDSPLPDLALIRQLARLLTIEQYVLLADGKTSAAIQSLRDGLRLAYIVKPETLIGGLTGRAVDTMALTHLGRHVDQLPVKDCDRLIALVKEYLSAPDPLFDTLDADRRMALSTLDLMRRWQREFLKSPEALNEPDDPMEKKGWALAKDPVALEAHIREVAARINAHYEAHIAALRLPPWKRGEMPGGLTDTSPAGITARNLVPNLILRTTRITQSRVQMQLLGVHAAIRRYRWEHDRLPDTLADMPLGNLAIDPYSGKPLLYRRTGETAYELSSVGPPKRDENGSLLPGKETEPILLPSRPPS